MMHVSPITRLTVRSLASADYAVARAAVGELVEYLQAVGNTQEQIEYWLSYSAEMSALEDETLESVIEAEAIMARMQGLIL